MDVDAYVAVHQSDWDRLEALTRRGGRLRGAELDELVDLYQRVGTQLSVVRTSSPDPVLVGRLTRLAARARAQVVGRRTVSWSVAAVFVTRTFPAAAWKARWWWLGAAVICLGVGTAEAVWIATSPEVQARLLPAAQVRQLVDHDFAGYYHAAPHSSFAAQVWTNNAWVAAQCLVGGLALGIVPLLLLLATAVEQLGPAGGYLFAAGHGGEFLALILPHGLLELTAVFLSAGAGLRLGWTIIDPGPRSRARALAQEGRAVGVLAVGCAGMLLISGFLEGFLTPSGLPPGVRVAIGASVWAIVLAYVVILGRRATAAGLTGDLDEELAGGYALEG